MSSKAKRSDHYLAIAEFYGESLIADIRNPKVPDFVLMDSARRSAHFALAAVRMIERRCARGPAASTFRPRRESADSMAALSPSLS